MSAFGAGAGAGAVLLFIYIIHTPHQMELKSCTARPMPQVDAMFDGTHFIRTNKHRPKTTSEVNKKKAQREDRSLEEWEDHKSYFNLIISFR